MALPYLDLYKLVNDAPFQHRVQFALWRAANVVMREDVGTPNHAQRLVWAKEALRGPTQQMTSVITRVAATGAVYNTGAAVSDDDLQAIVNGLVNDMAGV